MNNWKVTYTSINSLKSVLLESGLTYNEARKMAKEYQDADDGTFHYQAKKQ